MIRHKTGETIPVQIVIWFGSCYGATASDYSSFKQAIILARITPLNAASPNATRIRPAHPSGGLLGFDGPSGNGAGTGTLPRRRNLSFTGGITLPPPLPPLYMAGEGFAPLPPLPPIGFSSALQPLPPLPSQRARRPSGSLAPLPHEGLASGSDLSLPPLSRPRSRTSSLLGQHSRSLSNGPLTTFPSSSYEKPMAIPPVPIDEFPPLPRPASRNKR